MVPKGFGMHEPPKRVTQICEQIDMWKLVRIFDIQLERSVKCV